MAGSARRALINALIWSLCFAAFLAIAALLSGGDVEGASRVVVTFLAVGLYSATSLAGLSAAARPPARRLAPVIWTLSAAGFLSAVAAIWDPNEDEALQRLAWSVAVAAASAAQVGLIAARARAHDGRAIRAGEVSTAAAALALAVLVVRAIASSEDSEGFFRTVGVIAIADAYGIFAMPLLRLLRADAAPRGTQRRLVMLLVAVLTLAAAAGILGIVRNSVDEDLGRLLATLPFAGLYGATALAGVVARRLPRYELLGGLTILASGFALVAALNVIWVSDFDFEGGGEADFRWAWFLFALAGTLAHVSVLLARQRAADSPSTTTLVRWAVVAAVAAGFMLAYPAADDDVEGGFVVWLAIVLILDVLATTVVALLRKRDSAPV
jgi:hypothetical protein